MRNYGHDAAPHPKRTEWSIAQLRERQISNLFFREDISHILLWQL